MLIALGNIDRKQKIINKNKIGLLNAEQRFTFKFIDASINKLANGYSQSLTEKRTRSSQQGIPFWGIV